ncbi:MAG: hypothetical protein LJE62_06355 [Silicimonas sp.]|nr:hypothetical protein [Silicimonas sp.]
MADRAGGKGKPGVPKEVFELDKDERWQARLEDARARREIALREKAEGKPPQPRPKPWELEGATHATPPDIEPVIQERGDDKFDFADRLDTIRDSKKASVAQGAGKTDGDRGKPRERREFSGGRGENAPDFPPPSVASPDPVPTASRETRPRGKSQDKRARPQPSLIMPGAPDIADLASRYAATLRAPVSDTTVADRAFSQADDDEQPAPTYDSNTNLVTLPTAAGPVPAEAAIADVPSNSRRGIRPLGMAIALLGLALLPFSTEAPPLETGPDMPRVDVLRIQPALGVTWSLYERPFQTRSGAWRPKPAPLPLLPLPFDAPARLADEVSIPPEPPVGSAGTIDWADIDGVTQQLPEALEAPEDVLLIVPEVPDVPAPPVERLDDEVLQGAAAEPAPQRPATLQTDVAEAGQEGEFGIAAPLIGEPLRLTILAPAQADPELTDAIAGDVEASGHDLVRVKEVGFNISQRNLRYFHDRDRATAAQLAERYDAELRDFTWFQPKPVEGTAELWLSGRSVSAPVPSESVVEREARPLQIPERRENGLGRIFDRLGLGGDLPETVQSPGRGILSPIRSILGGN